MVLRQSRERIRQRASLVPDEMCAGLRLQHERRVREILAAGTEMQVPRGLGILLGDARTQPGKQRDGQGPGIGGFIGERGHLEVGAGADRADHRGGRRRDQLYGRLRSRQRCLEAERGLQQRLVTKHRQHLCRRRGAVTQQRGQRASR